MHFECFSVACETKMYREVRHYVLVSFAVAKLLRIIEYHIIKLSHYQ